MALGTPAPWGSKPSMPAQRGLALPMSTCPRRQGCWSGSAACTCSCTAACASVFADGHSWAHRALRTQVHTPCPQGCAHPVAPREHTCALCQQDTRAERGLHAAAPSHWHWHPAGWFSTYRTARCSPIPAFGAPQCSSHGCCHTARVGYFFGEKSIQQAPGHNSNHGHKKQPCTSPWALCWPRCLHPTPLVASTLGT